MCGTVLVCSCVLDNLVCLLCVCIYYWESLELAKLGQCLGL